MGRSPDQNPRGPEDLEGALARLRTDLVFPDTPDIAAAFAMTAPVRPVRTLRRSPLPYSPWWGLAAAVLLLVVATVAIPGARATVASWFDVPGIRIEVGDDEAVRTPPASIGGSLLLGRPITIADAGAAAGFVIVAPADTRGGAPETYLLERDGATIVSLLYPAGPGLPGIGSTGAGLLLMQIDSPEHVDLLVKRSMNEQPPITVMLGGGTGTWIAGGSLTLEPVYETGTFERSSGNVLIWEQNGVTYRMESALTMTDAVALAEGLQPLPTAVVPDP